MKQKLLFVVSLIFSAFAGNAQGTWTPVATPAPDYNHGVMVLLTDGTVMAKTSAGSSDVYGDTWDKLTPDIHGSYANGTWTRCGQMYDSRLYFSSQVLKSGCLYVAGGEYGTGRRFGEIYYPIPDVWIQAPHLPVVNDTISDANSEMLPDGRVLQAIVSTGNSISLHTYLYNPLTNTYTAGPATPGIDNESAWLKLPDNSILYVDRLTTNSERYIPATNSWVHDAALPAELYDVYGDETGAGFLLPDGRGFFIGSTSRTSYYTPSGSAAPGAWAAGPAIPDSLGAPDAAAAMMTNGHILCAFSPTPILDSVFQRPMVFYEFNYLTNSFTPISAPDGTDSLIAPSYFSNMLCLPDGNILYSSQADDQYYIYTPGSAPLAAGKPVVNNIINVDCDTFIATGTLFNGITEGAAYGDDWQMATNYPIIRLKRNDTVYYAATYNWNSTGVMRGSSPDTTQFVIPAGIPEGNYWLQVVANGNASDSILFSQCAPAGVKNIVMGSGINVYPNPAGNTATVVFTSKKAGQYSIKLFDILGRVVIEKNSIASIGENNYTLQLDKVKSGIYTIIICDEDGSYHTKLIVEK